MRSAPVIAAVLGAACVTCATTGASAALTAIPPVATFVTGAVLVCITLLDARFCNSRRALWSALMAGALAGLLLPLQAPGSDSVVSRSIGASAHGDLFDALNRLDADPNSLIGRRIVVTGRWTPASGGHRATVSRHVMTCCAADAIDVGFDVEAVDRSARRGAWVRVDGIVRQRLADGDVRYVLEESCVDALEDSGENAY